jgi:hypothetical protein
MELNFTKLLKNKTKTWTSKLTKMAKAKAPRHIAPYITSSSIASGARYEINVWVKPVEKVSETGAISNYGSVDAFAQEYGHPGAVITPRPGREFLSFPWEKANKKIRRLPNGDVLLKQVTKLPQPAYNGGYGYLRPAVREWRNELDALEMPQIAKAIFIDLRKGFSFKGKTRWVVG